MNRDIETAQWTAHRLARFVACVKPGDLPDSSVEAAVRCVLDLVGAAAAGFHSRAAESARRFVPGFFPPGPSSVWFTSLMSHPAGAAMANSSAACALDLDDGNRSAGGHPGASIIPAALAVTQQVGAGAEEFLRAVVVGYEVAVRVAAARNPATLDTFSTGRWCGYGVCAAGGLLRGTAPEILTHAFGLAGLHAPNQSASSYGNVSHMAKEGISWATLTGLGALDLAEQGFSGPVDILDSPCHFDPGHILEGLGSRWAVEQTYFKPFACCRWAHASIDALCGLMNDHGLDSDEITGVEVHTFKRALGLGKEGVPDTLEGIQYSIPYCCAIAAVEGPSALLPLNEGLLGREDLQTWASRVSLHEDPAHEARFPGKAGATVIVKTATGTWERAVENPLGDPANPYDLEGLEGKFRAAVERCLDSRDVEELLRGVYGLTTGSLDGLVRALGRCGVIQAGREPS